MLLSGYNAYVPSFGKDGLVTIFQMLRLRLPRYASKRSSHAMQPQSTQSLYSKCIRQSMEGSRRQMLAYRLNRSFQLLDSDLYRTVRFLARFAVFH